MHTLCRDTAGIPQTATRAGPSTAALIKLRGPHPVPALPSVFPGIYVRALQELFRIASEEDGVATAAAAAAAAAAASTDTSNGDGPTEGQPSSLPGAQSGAMPLGRFSVCVSMLEIYNEAVHDLLAPGGVSAVAKPLDVSGLGECEGAATHDVHVCASRRRPS